MAMTPALIARYQPGGDIYAKLEVTYTRKGALVVAQAAQSGDQFAVTDALERVKYGERLSESTARLFWGQITTDPFEAPLASANKAIGTIGSSAIIGLFKNPWVLVAVAALVFYALGGFGWAWNKLKLT